MQSGVIPVAFSLVWSFFLACKQDFPAASASLFHPQKDVTTQLLIQKTTHQLLVAPASLDHDVLTIKAVDYKILFSFKNIVLSIATECSLLTNHSKG